MDRRRLLQTGIGTLLAAPLAGWATASPSDMIAPFRYSAIVQAHLGGDDFRVASVRLDLGSGRAQLARVWIGGRIESLSEHALTGADPLPGPLPRPAPPPRSSGGPPPMEVEGMGPTGTAAGFDGRGRVEVTTQEAPDPAASRPPEVFARFDAALRARVGGRLSTGEPGLYLRLSLLPEGARIPGAERIGMDALRRSVLFRQLHSQPFALLRVPETLDGAADAALAGLEPGQMRAFVIRHRTWRVRCYRLA